MKKLIIISIALMLLGSILIAQPKDPKHNPVPARASEWNQTNLKDRLVPQDAMMDCMDELKLTDAQKKKFEDLRMAFHKSKNTLEADIQNLHIDLKSALKDENYKQAKELNKQISAKELTLADARIDFMAARMKELNPDQKEVLKKSMQNMRQHGKEMMMQNHCKGQGMMMQKQHKNNSGCNDCGEHKGDNSGCKEQGKMMQKQHGNNSDCGDCGEHKGPNPKTKVDSPK